MTTEEIYAKLEQTLKELKGEGFIFSPNLSITDELTNDSVEVMEFIVSTEEEFGVEIPDAVIDQASTLEDLVVYLQQETAKLEEKKG